ncbi:unnamed protein product [Arctia plantaginis]|uniref:Uncharacterized protein n=1 Tax=Arctia plantaginis TaxID=874455 RepID=A0A8S1B0E9_ARCPL|nr:unnamed protein product [Arctia plantaginis]
MSDSDRLKPHAFAGRVDDPRPVWEPHVPCAPWKRARFATRSPPPRPASARVTDGLTCHPQACAYGGRRSFCDLRRLSRLRCLARARAWRAGRVLNFSRSRSAVSFASITCSQKETAEFHALSLRTIAAIRLSSERTQTPMAATRSRLCSTHAGHSASVWRAVSTVWPSQWWHSGVGSLRIRHR